MITVSPQAPAPLSDRDALARNFEAVRARVALAAQRAGRDPTAVTVLAVSKTVPVERLRAAVAAGITELGENRVQEASPKVAALGRDLTWHLIGHLQRNKAAAAVRLFDMIHSVDSFDLATVLDRQAARLGKQQRVLLQVNVSGEQSKSGFTLAALRAVAEEVAALPHLRPEGLMTIAPLGAGESVLHDVFGTLRTLHQELALAFPGEAWQHLSMGMSDDYEIAVAEGATLVRVGRAIFGERPPMVTGA